MRGLDHPWGIFDASNTPTDTNPACAAMSREFHLMPLIVEEQLESIRIDRSDPSRHSNLSSKIAARSAAIFFSQIRMPLDSVKKF